MACACNYSLQNTGTPNCVSVFNIAKKLILVPLYDNTGSLNSLDLSVSLNSAFFSSKINEADASKRWYPTPILENVEDVKADPITQSLNSGANLIVSEASRTFTGSFIKQSTTFMGKLKSFGCTKFGVFIVDKEGNLIGRKEGSLLYPIAVDENTFNVTLVKATDSTFQEIKVMFEFDRSELDESLAVILASEMSVKVLTLKGLLDINPKIGTQTLNDVEFTLTLDYGTAKNPIAVQGLTLSDFSVYNNTGSAIAPLASVTETSDGVYKLIYATAFTGGESLTLTISKVGFETVTYNYVA